MKQPEIVVLSGETRYDQWENFLFKDNAGKEHKIGAKNKKTDEIANVVIANPGRAVEIAYDTVTGKEGKVFDYIKLVEIQVDETELTKQQVVIPVAKTAPAPQELGMWWKEMGECIRSGAIDKDFPNMAIKIKGQYYKQMETVTGISMKKED